MQEQVKATGACCACVTKKSLEMIFGCRLRLVKMIEMGDRGKLFGYGFIFTSTYLGGLHFDSMANASAVGDLTTSLILSLRKGHVTCAAAHMEPRVSVTSPQQCSAARQGGKVDEMKRLRGQKESIEHRHEMRRWLCDETGGRKRAESPVVRSAG